jgi:hypothetical protein
MLYLFNLAPGEMRAVEFEVVDPAKKLFIKREEEDDIKIDQKGTSHPLIREISRFNSMPLLHILGTTGD